MLVEGQDAVLAVPFDAAGQTQQALDVLLIGILDIPDAGAAYIDPKLQSFEIYPVAHLRIDKGVRGARADGEHMGVIVDEPLRINAVECLVDEFSCRL